MQRKEKKTKTIWQFFRDIKEKNKQIIIKRRLKNTNKKVLDKETDNGKSLDC